MTIRNHAPMNSTAFRYFLLLTTTLCGALVMIVEVLGARVIGPYFGVSLFVWTALITVTLLALSIGYALGGWLADRRPAAEWLYGLIAVAGVLVMLVPTLKPGVILLTAPLGLRIGALLSATLLFAPALLLLGCVSPYVVRIAAQAWDQLGRTVGLLYALSTVGSMVGTALAGYWIIAYVGVANAYRICGALLILLSASYFMFFRGHKAALGGVAALLAVLVWPAPELPAATLADGTRARLIESRDSRYGSVKVVEYAGPSMATRELLIDGLIQGGIDQATGQSVYEYAYLLEALPLEVNPQIRNTLIVGLGAGILAKRLQQRGIEVEVVDIDPTVVALATKHFDLRLKNPVVIEDARYFFTQGQTAYDLIVMDAFTGDATPSHLLSREALAQVKVRLSAGGLLAINVIGSTSKESALLPAVIGTLQTQFAHLAMFPLLDPSNAKGTTGNFVILAGDRALDASLRTRINEVHPLAAPLVHAGMQRAHLVRRDAALPVLTDDFNPLDVLDVGLHEQVRKVILETTPASILLHG